MAWLNKIWYSHVIDYYIGFKRNKLYNNMDRSQKHNAK